MGVAGESMPLVVEGVIMIQERCTVPSSLIRTTSFTLPATGPSARRSASGLVYRVAAAGNASPPSGNMHGFLVPVFELGLLCSAGSPEQRMAMSDVVVTLNKIRKDYVKLWRMCGAKNIARISA
uniref:Serine-threonine/tyrosine-protein kinase catalytic domain-containing protein n=1 Tax=Oryza nivara TaxID=4536 RepID=A0A679BD04_ORYNI|nr:hypothetical protein [Oryza sativa f. spontanea]